MTVIRLLLEPLQVQLVVVTPSILIESTDDSIASALLLFFVTFRTNSVAPVTGSGTSNTTPPPEAELDELFASPQEVNLQKQSTVSDPSYGSYPTRPGPTGDRCSPAKGCNFIGGAPSTLNSYNANC